MNDRRLSCPGFYHMPQAADGGICRIKLALGRLTLQQSRVLADAAEQYGNGSIELTTRGNIQLRGIAGNNRQKLVEMLTGCGLGPLTKAGDNIRNVMVNPTAGFDRSGSDFTTGFAADLLRRLQTSPDYQKLSPKFSFYIDGGEACAVLHHSSDIWLSITDEGRSFAFGIASCPPADSSSAPALGMAARERGTEIVTALLDCLRDAARQNSAIRRMKHLTGAWGHERIIRHMKQKIADLAPASAFRRLSPAGRRDLGIHQTRFPNRYYVGVKPPLGRFSPQSLRRLTSIACRIRPAGRLQVTPWQSLIFTDCAYHEARALARACRNSGLVTDQAAPYANITCCAGLPGCASACADVQADAHKLAAALPYHAAMPVHLIACPKSCTATHARPVTLLATQAGLYDVYYQDNSANSKFGRRAAGKVTIDDVTAILSAGFDRDQARKPECCPDV